MDAQAADPERSILKRLRGTAHYFDSRVGLSRVGLVLSLTIIAVAVVVLYHILSPSCELVDWDSFRRGSPKRLINSARSGRG